MRFHRRLELEPSKAKEQWVIKLISERKQIEPVYNTPMENDALHPSGKQIRLTSLSSCAG